MNSNKLKGTLCADPKQARRRHIPQIQWKCPPKYTLDPNWYVAAGEESTEAITQRRVSTDPRPSMALRKASENCDSKTPVIPLIPIEEEGNLQNNSSEAFLTATAMSAETMALAINALAALNACALREGEQTPIDMDTFIHMLNNSDTVHRYISGQDVPEIKEASMLSKPTQAVPSTSSNPDQLYFNTSDNCVKENTSVGILKPSDWTPSVPFQDVLDMDRLARLLDNPEDIEKLNKLCDASDRSGK